MDRIQDCHPPCKALRNFVMPSQATGDWGGGGGVGGQLAGSQNSYPPTPYSLCPPITSGGGGRSLELRRPETPAT